MTRPRVILIAITIVAVVAYVVFTPLNPLDDKRFGQSAWKKPRFNRQPMAQSAMRQVRDGMSESEVLALLGKPDEVRTLEDGGGHKLPGKQAYAYHVGSSWNMDDTFLYVHLDDNGNVIDSQIIGY